MAFFRMLLGFFLFICVFFINIYALYFRFLHLEMASNELVLLYWRELLIVLVICGAAFYFNSKAVVGQRPQKLIVQHALYSSFLSLHLPYMVWLSLDLWVFRASLSSSYFFVFLIKFSPLIVGSYLCDRFDQQLELCIAKRFFG